MGFNITVSGLVKVEYSIQPLESSQISVLNVIAVYKAVLNGKDVVGGAAGSAPIVKWLTTNEVQKLSQDGEMLPKSQFLFQYLAAVEQGGGVAKEKGGAVLHYVDREISWVEKVLNQAQYGASGMLQWSLVFTLVYATVQSFSSTCKISEGYP